MKITDLRIGDIVAEKTTRFPMKVVGILEDGTLYLNFDGNEGDAWEVKIEDVEMIKN